ncbi:uncharacterized protein TNCV_3509861 [Trichonephila clavipes]|nr:uncharacterized protein TNCV_3509861 [Trichonephila clavipes]
MITNFFIPELNNHDVQELWFQQDGATCHTARATIYLLKDTFGDCLISRFGPVNGPPRSCDLTPLDYFLWGYVKSLVYADKPQTLDHLKDNIRRVIADIRPQMLEKVIENWTSRLHYIRASRGSHIPLIIFKMQGPGLPTPSAVLATPVFKLTEKTTEISTNKVSHGIQAKENENSDLVQVIELVSMISNILKRSPEILQLLPKLKNSEDDKAKALLLFKAMLDKFYTTYSLLFQYSQVQISKLTPITQSKPLKRSPAPAIPLIPATDFHVHHHHQRAKPSRFKKKIEDGGIDVSQFLINCNHPTRAVCLGSLSCWKVKVWRPPWVSPWTPRLI